MQKKQVYNSGRRHWPVFPTPESTYWKFPEWKMAERSCLKEIDRTKFNKIEDARIFSGKCTKSNAHKLQINLSCIFAKFS
jgi:hypothetical protein